MYGGYWRSAHHLLREGPTVPSSAPTTWADEPGCCCMTHNTRGISSGLVLNPTPLVSGLGYDKAAILVFVLDKQSLPSERAKAHAVESGSEINLLPGCQGDWTGIQDSTKMWLWSADANKHNKGIPESENACCLQSSKNTTTELSIGSCEVCMSHA